MMRCAFLLATLASGLAMATSVPPKPLAEMVAEADHVVVATVAVVDMVDGKGRPVLDRDARTGPGLDNQIRLHLAVSEVLRTDNVRLPKTLVAAAEPGVLPQHACLAGPNSRSGFRGMSFRENGVSVLF